ncbi:GGDEF domain-containing protein [Marinobacter sp. UBA3607]|jgi:diguanylate cyclase (GGDEF)-like protein|uniref:GGDEF domain-containing protein n=1 Tax=Marinobacter sp. UBA3607 TaxID=1946820 RepID=UPI000E984AD5|nr:GGDEF domain-containing protein [Marinobacter sp. UBA3607]HBM50200.1 GGDEF domain-containing protein [Marinobacter sp.]|tara:strand:+ start:4646 stop:5749 length:1104 start_codon:yes stop_codon:yes gene_type:complete
MTDTPSASQIISTDHEDRQISRLLNGLSGMALLFLTGIGLKAWFADHHSHAIVLWLFNVPVLANMLWYARTGNRLTQKVGLLTTVALLFAYLIASGGEGNTGPLWFYVFPPLLFFLTSLKAGTAILLFCYLLAIIVFQFPDLPGVTGEYSTDFKIRFFATLTFESIFCFVLEAGRLQTRNKLVKLAQSHEQAARTDELTGLANRRYMHSRLTAEFSRYQRSGHHFSVVLIDLDLFKRINDNYGHDAGDTALQHFARLVRQVIRQTDVAARWGGEEFLILLPDTTLLQALSLAERLRTEVASAKFQHQGQELPVTISAGVCSISKAGSVNELLKQADLNLYSAKGDGRNRIAPRVRSQDSQVPEESPA